MMSSAQILAGRPLVARAPTIRRTQVRSGTTRAAFTLPELPYAKDALAPNISAETLDYHHGKHHATYINNLNGQIEGTDLADKSLEEVVLETWNNGNPTPAFNNAAQSWNHTFYWNCMSPNGGGKPSGPIAEAIDSAFGSFDKFKEEFSKAGATQFGSGWAWLVLDGGELKIKKTLNAENPITSGDKPLLVMDVWEHAYYVDFRNARPKYISTFIDELINWDFVAENYKNAK